MFKRTVQVSLAKPKKVDTSTDAPTTDIQTIAANATVVMNNVAESATKMMVAYMLADTVRKIAVSRLGK